MDTIYIPASLDEAKTALGGISKLLTAKQWERAAIVYAFTEPQQGHRTDLVGNPTRLTITAFAGLGLTGLRSKEQVIEYRTAWESAAKEVAKTNAHLADEMRDLGPGEAIEMPDLVWKDHFGEATADVQDRVARSTILRNPAIVKDAVSTFPEVAKAAVEGLAADPVVARKGMDAAHPHAVAQVRSTADQAQYQYPAHVTPAIQPSATRDWEGVVRIAFSNLSDALRAEQRGEWQPSGMAQTALSLLSIALQRREDAKPSTIWDEIDAHLAAASVKWLVSRSDPADNKP